MKFSWKRFNTGLLAIALASCGSSLQESPSETLLDKLEREFVNPPISSRPRTWFHVMSGNMTKEGITKDLESIKSVGIGGVLLFNVTQGIPVGPIKFNSEEHIELIRHMAAESERLGLAFGVHNCDGWTSSGGPWITPENSMKKVVWSETYTRGGAIDVLLPEPDKLENYYEDIATIAYPSLSSELDNLNNLPRVSSSQADLDIGLITDGSVVGTTRLEATKEAPAYIQFEYTKPYSVKSVRFRFMNARLANTLLLSSDDGVNFVPVKNLALRRPAKNDWGNDEALETPATARYFRLQTDVPLDVQEVELSSIESIGNFWGRSGSAKTVYSDLPPIGPAPESSIIKASSIINLSKDVDKKGQLKTHLPEGDWTIMRFGQTSTGARNLPASKEGIGLEVDKFNRSAVKVHYDAFMTNVVEAVKDVAPNAHQYTEIDSYEVGAQNWTTGYDALFETSKGYSLIPFLPLYAGRFVESSDVSEQVTWDMRGLSNQLMSDNYYGYFTELANADGLQVYIEPYGDGPFNELDAGAKADIPMGEFWVNRFGNRVNVAVSSAALYGKPIVSTEAFTDVWDVNWKLHPAYVKTLGDTNWALGVNELMFHRFAHQANTHVKPGMTMNRWGSHFDRTQTWWDSAGKDWFEYLSRGQHLLRQGVPVNDALLFVGDGTPSICPDKEKTNSVPFSLNFICLNSDVLQNRLTIGNEAFELPGGTSYKFIILENSETMTRDSLEALDRLSAEGSGFVIGEPPQILAGFIQRAEDQKLFKTKVANIWARDNVLTREDVVNEGWGDFLKSIKFRTDFSIDGPMETLFTHRKIGKNDIYFVHNPTKEPWEFTARFRVSDKSVSLWNPMNGAIEGVKAYNVMDYHTTVDLELEPQESVFVMFDGESVERETIIKRPSKDIASLALKGAWDVTFDPEFGTDKTVKFDKLIDWKDSQDSDIYHYSGPALYETKVDISDEFLKSGDSFKLDLGDVQVAATVNVNGVDLGTTWIAPHTVDITDTLKSGQNSISISVVNLWVNRLIGDAALPDLDGFTPAEWIPKAEMPQWYTQNKPPNLGQRVTFTTAEFYKADDALVPSGLIGPVSIIAESGG